MHPRSKHWHLIDYVITRRRDIRDILITRAVRGATAGPTMCCYGAEQLFQLARKHRRQASSEKEKVDVKKLSEPPVQHVLKDALASKLPADKAPQRLPQTTQEQLC